MTADPARLRKCPFCGATPHRERGKVYRDQLHGEEHQDFVIKCPHGCARFTRPTCEAAIAAWNTRAKEIEDEV